MPTYPTFRRRSLGRRLRQMREQANMKIERAAAALDRSRSQLYRVECGETKADIHLVRSMMDLYDQYDEGLLDQARAALKPGWWATFGLKDMGYVDVETEAERVSELAMVYIPGLLQTKSYMRAVFEADDPDRSAAEVSRQMRVRTIRQERLTSEQRPLRLVALVHEMALRSLVGGQDVMQDQLEHLIMMAEVDTVTLRVLPSVLGARGLAGAFTLLDFADPYDRPMLYVSYPTGSLHVEDIEEVHRAKLLYDHLLDRALSPEDSVALIEQIRAESE